VRHAGGTRPAANNVTAGTMFTLGEVAFGLIHESAPAPGCVVAWHPSPASLAKAQQAPISAVPASNQQADHLHSVRQHAAADLVIPRRLLVPSWDIAGQCDIQAMTYVLNSHLRRHDTYHSWFEYTDADGIVRHTIPEPTDIELVPTVYGGMTPAEWRSHILATPNPLQWACFRFMIIQRADHFTFSACVDHIHADATFFGVAFTEIHTMYATLVDGERPIRLAAAGSYDDYCVRQRASISALTLESPEIRQWIEFAENNGGTLPKCPLPLGDASPTPDLMSAQLLDEQQTAEFESACLAAGARFSGGVFACAALAQYELTGANTFYGLTSADTRRTPADFMTMGFFTGHVPITVPITASSFGDTVRAAQASFDSGKDLADVPFGRVLALAPWLRGPQHPVPVHFYFDVGCPPFSGLFSSQVGGLNFRIDRFVGFGGEFATRVFRLEKETQVIAQFPDNPVARDSVTRYITALKSVYARVADAHGA
jgi:mycolipenoyl-CoA---2-(long-chain-fatty acyl)-trehalose mycolipenoyltransferase / long-chain-acyl-CoA---trehalose acyltransferase